MTTLYAELGETVYRFLERCIQYCNEASASSVKAVHNGVTIYVYKDGSISDLCDKWSLQRQMKRIDSY